MRNECNLTCHARLTYGTKFDPFPMKRLNPSAALQSALWPICDIQEFRTIRVKLSAILSRR